jgi:hypothetical protein
VSASAAASAASTYIRGDHRGAVTVQAEPRQREAAYA